MASSKACRITLRRLVLANTAPFQRKRHLLRTSFIRTFSTAVTTSSKKEGYQSIGSFHSDDVEELIRLPDGEYTPPQLPFPNETATNIAIPNPSSTAFANSAAHQRAYSRLHRHEWTFLNHGAFGLALDTGINRANSWRNFLESQPLRYFDRYLLNHLAHSARCLVDFVSNGAEEEELMRLREGVALIGNVTSGMNAVIGGHARCSSTKFHGKDSEKVFYYDIAYGSNKKMCQTYHGKENAIAIPFEEDFLPLLQRVTNTTSRQDNDWNSESTDIFLKALDATIQNEISKGTTPKTSLCGSLLILDHITSNTAIHTPISSIAKYAKEEYGMVVAVDGAHGLLGLDLNISETLSFGGNDSSSGLIDVYVTNAHKWFSSPRGAAVMFCTNPLIRETILRQPAVVSHGVDDGFLSRFLWDGCRDYAAQLAIPAIVDFWDSVNGNNLQAEMERNLLEGVRILISRWHPGVCSSGGDDADLMVVLKHSAEAGLTLVPMEMHAPMMALVRLPNGISGREKGSLDSQCSYERKSSTDAKKVQDFLYNEKVEVPVKCIRGVLFVRVSCHIYNTAREFERLADTALKFR
ncbi:hypothetical protein HJC23_009186 [Cyclotella cryptica]|uniref:Aminotransferase class V domain-containing protein n=1 Tax=Cyclotella cryptica TaxID=29204 RepID=A0ABD3PJK1_9STRA|eukprot:CCRYP_013797-RA/>CCRYP_013797-RA protein AED:0.01 eAED:0.01 QI:175/-1/1/1/-1/1/1/118/579